MLHTPIFRLMVSLFALLSLSNPATAQESKARPAGTQYAFNLKQLKTGPLSWPFGDWVITGRRSSVIFNLDHDYEWTEWELFSMSVSDKGKTKTPVSLWNSTENEFFGMAAVWLPDSGVGMLFLARSDDPLNRKIVVEMATFDEEGLLTSGFKLVTNFFSPDNTHYFIFTLAAGQRGSAAGVTAIAVSNDDGKPNLASVAASQGRFTEILPDGYVTGTSSIKLKNGGARQIAITHTPFWSGDKWFVPITSTFMAKNNPQHPDYWYPALNKLYNLRVFMKNDRPYKLKLGLLWKDNTKDYWTYDYACFVPLGLGGAAPGAKPLFPLLYTHKEPIPQAEVKFEQYTFERYIMNLNAEGKNSGASRTPVDIPAWKHSRPYNAGDTLFDPTRALSAPLFGENGEFLCAMTRSNLWMPKSGPYEFENLLEFFSIDLTTGKVTTLARREPLWPGPAAWNCQPLIGILNGHVVVINQLTDYYNGENNVVYFSRF
jgi:hypothetical protein